MSDGNNGEKTLTRKRRAVTDTPVSVPAPPDTPKKFSTSVASDGTPPKEIIEAALAFQTELNMPTWLMCQGIKGYKHEKRLGTIDVQLRDAIIHSIKRDLPSGQKVAIVIDSPGGNPHCAYQIARAFRDHCGGYVAVVPRYAKSAATLLCLGADQIILGSNAELGPLDMQVTDPDVEEQRSVLEYVQALERLEAYTLRLLDDSMQLLMERTGKKVASLLPQMIQFSTGVVKPLYENVDVVQYTQMARLHKVVQDYAVRLLSWQLPANEANLLAQKLTSEYSDHSFVIDFEEAERVGLSVERFEAEAQEKLDAAACVIRRTMALGVLREAS